MTLLTELLDESAKRGRKWLILPRKVVLVYLPTALRWDDGDLVDATVAPLIVNRILGALDQAGEEHSTETSGEVYQQASRDWRALGPSPETSEPWCRTPPTIRRAGR